MNTHEIYHGNCTEVLSKLKKDSVQLVVTSPPYYNAREYSKYTDYDDYLAFMDEVIGLLPSVLIEGGYFCLNSTTYMESRKVYGVPFDLLNISTKHGFDLVWDVIWLKPRYTQALWRSCGRNYNAPYPFKLYLNCFHEYIWILRLGEEEREIDQDTLERSKIIGNKVDIKGKMRDQKVLDYSYREWNLGVAKPSKEGHSAPYPLEIPFRCIEQFSVKEDTVLDPFLGTGTTSRAAMLLGRNSIGIELNEEYFKLIEKKLLPKQKDMYQYMDEEELQKTSLQKNRVEFKNADFMKEPVQELYIDPKTMSNEMGTTPREETPSKPSKKKQTSKQKTLFS